MTRPTRFVTSSEWGANDARNATPSSHPIDNPRGVTVHWTGNGMGGSWLHSRCADLVRGIERSHEFGNGWGDVAYNLLPCPHGYVFEGRGINVRSAANGGTESNSTHYAVCYLGGVGDDFTENGKRAIVESVRYLRDEGGAGDDVNGHRDHKSTQCPGDVIYRWIQTASFAVPRKPSRGRNVGTAIRALRRARRHPDNAGRGPFLRRVGHALRDLTSIRKR